ncbi:MAG TPA: YfeC-like transcriptional regulator, partial [Candidatus Saccharimonadales bacterium]
MQSYYKSKELAALYGVTRQTVNNWVDSVKNGKLVLDRFDENGQTYIRNTPANHARIKAMVESRKKFKNTKSQKTVT